MRHRIEPSATRARRERIQALAVERPRRSSCLLRNKLPQMQRLRSHIV